MRTRHRHARNRHSILAFSHCRDVVAAVTKAGGLGVLGAAGHSDKQLEIDLDWIEEQVGDLPYVDLIVPAKYTGSDQGGMTVAELGEMILVSTETSSTNSSMTMSCPPSTKSSRGRRIQISATHRRPGCLNLRSLAHKAALVVNALGPLAHMLDSAHEQGQSLLSAWERRNTPNVMLRSGPTSSSLRVLRLVATLERSARWCYSRSSTHSVKFPYLALAVSVEDVRWQPRWLSVQKAWCGSVWLTTEEAETHPTVKEKPQRHQTHCGRNLALVSRLRQLRTADRRLGRSRKPEAAPNAVTANAR